MINSIHYSLAVKDNCVNPESYGEICVRCNACGRFDKQTQKSDQIALYKRLIKENKDFQLWADDPQIRKLQKNNVSKNIEHYKKKIAALKADKKDTTKPL